MATSSFQKNFTVSKRQQDNVVSVMTSDSLGALISNKFDSKFKTVDSHKEVLSKIFSKKTN